MISSIFSVLSEPPLRGVPEGVSAMGAAADASYWLRVSGLPLSHDIRNYTGAQRGDCRRVADGW